MIGQRGIFLRISRVSRIVKGDSSIMVIDNFQLQVADNFNYLSEPTQHRIQVHRYWQYLLTITTFTCRCNKGRIAWWYKSQSSLARETYCRCGEFDFSRLVEPLNIKDVNCTLTPLPNIDSSNIPHTLTDRRARALILPYVEAFRRLIETSASLLLTYTSYILIVKMLSSLLWNFLTR